MADAGVANTTGNNRGRNNRNNNNRRNNRNNNYEEAEPNENGNKEPGSKTWRVKFANSRKVRPIRKEGKCTPVGKRHKTRTKRQLHTNYPDEENVLHMVQSSQEASRVAKEVANLFANYNTHGDMLKALYAKPMNYRIKYLVHQKLQRNASNLVAFPIPAPAVNMSNVSFNDPRYNVTKDPLYQ